jgi:hypothetical protein
VAENPQGEINKAIETLRHYGADALAVERLDAWNRQRLALLIRKAESPADAERALEGIPGSTLALWGFA